LDIQKCYIIILPAFGLISEAIIKEYKKEIFGKIGMIYAMGSIGLIRKYASEPIICIQQD
jgi:heme/copper-type cytochrome/quinol oxidase subunit 1